MTTIYVILNKEQPLKLMRQCSKCESTTRLEEHHFLPKVHFKKSNHTITLCRECHTKIETILMAVESFKGNVTFGTRYKLSRDDYMIIHKNWLRTSKILTLTF